jgi:hypothetical protein
MTSTNSYSTSMQTAAQARDAQAQAQAARAQAADARDQVQASRDQLREQIREQVRAAVEGAQDAAREGNPTTIQIPDGRGGNQRLTIGPNGVTLNGRNVGRGGEALTIDARNAIPNGVVDIVQAAGATLVLTIVGLPLARAFARWIDRRGTSPAIPTEVMSRLSNIENAVETVAVEVERISEGQRFTTKLLTDGSKRGNTPPSSIGDPAIR